MPQFQFLQQNPSFGSQLGQQLGSGISTGIQSALSSFNQMKTQENLQNKFIEQGFPKDLAALASIASTGGQTELLKKVLEERELRPIDKSLDSFSFTEEEIEEPMVPKGVPETRKERQAHEREREKRSFERNKKYLDKVSEILTEAPKEKVAIQQMEGALNSGDFNSWRNTLGDLTGYEFIKSASAQTVNSASKQYLMSSLAGLTGRPNQFIEKQITKALVNPQYTNEANKLILEGIKGLSQLKEKEAQIALGLEEKYTQQDREVPRNFQKIVKDKLKKEATEFEDRYQEMIKSSLSQMGKTVLMKDPSGNIRRVNKKDVQKAKSSGYKLEQ